MVGRNLQQITKLLLVITIEILCYVIPRMYVMSPVYIEIMC